MDRGRGRGLRVYLEPVGLGGQWPALKAHFHSRTVCKLHLLRGKRGFAAVLVVFRQRGPVFSACEQNSVISACFALKAHFHSRTVCKLHLLRGKRGFAPVLVVFGQLGP